MSELTKLANIGPKLTEQLESAGITTPEELKAVGAKEAWLHIKAIDPSACLMRLSALEGAVRGIRWHDLDKETMAELKEFYNRHK